MNACAEDGWTMNGKACLKQNNGPAKKGSQLCPKEDIPEYLIIYQAPKGNEEIILKFRGKVTFNTEFYI